MVRLYFRTAFLCSCMKRLRLGFIFARSCVLLAGLGTMTKGLYRSGAKLDLVPFSSLRPDGCTSAFRIAQKTTFEATTSMLELLRYPLHDSFFRRACSSSVVDFTSASKVRFSGVGGALHWQTSTFVMRGWWHVTSSCTDKTSRVPFTKDAARSLTVSHLSNAWAKRAGGSAAQSHAYMGFLGMIHTHFR